MRDYAKVGGKRGKPGYRTPTMFRNKVLRIVARIPKGAVLTYKEVAKRSGNLEASRAVGNILNKNYHPRIPCHRVIRGDGKIGGYNRGSGKKKELLKKEGVNFN